MKNTKLLHHSVIAGCLLGFTQVVLAAPISWVDEGYFFSEEDINMTGTVVRAAHGSRSTQNYKDTYIVTNTYGVVEFEPMGAESYANSVNSTNASVPLASGIWGADNIYQQGGSETFDNAMDTSIYNNGKTNDAGVIALQMELVLSNLTVGVEYQVQMFRSSENATDGGHNYCYYSDSPVAFEGNTTSTNLLAQAVYGTGRFTADATTQSIWSYNVGAVDDPAALIMPGGSLNAYVLLQEPFILPDPLPLPGDPLLPFSISTNSVFGTTENIITFPSQKYHDYTLWGSIDLIAWDALTATNGITGTHADVSVTNVPAASPYFYKVTGE